MPMVEVLYVSREPLGRESKRSFTEKAVRVFNEELGTAPSSLRLVFQHVEPEDSKFGLVDQEETLELPR